MSTLRERIALQIAENTPSSNHESGCPAGLSRVASLLSKHKHCNCRILQMALNATSGRALTTIIDWERSSSSIPTFPLPQPDCPLPRSENEPMDSYLIDAVARTAHDLLNSPARGGTLNVAAVAYNRDASLSTEKRGFPVTGYYVGGFVRATVVKTCTPEVIARFIREHAAPLTDGRLVTYLGVWQSPDSDNGGKVYIDVVDWHETEALAETVAISRSELAYWDIRAGKAVHV